MLRAHDLSEVEMIAITYPQLIDCLSKATLAKARELFLLVLEHVALALVGINEWCARGLESCRGMHLV